MGLLGPPMMTSSSSDGDVNGEEAHQRSTKSRSGSPTPCNSPRHSRNNSNNSGGGGGGGGVVVVGVNNNNSNNNNSNNNNNNNAPEDIIDSASSTLRAPLHLDR